jgi:hypothetical protein
VSEGETYHVADFSGPAGPGEEDVSAAALAEFVGGGAGAEELTDLYWSSSGEAGEDREEDGLGVHGV